MSLQEGMAGIQQRPDHVVFRIGEARLVETHALGQQPEHFDIRFCFARRRQRGTSELQVVMPVSQIKIGVFQERSRRQQNVGMIRGVVLKLLQHDGEKILAPHSRQHQVLIRSDGRRIRVVDHHRLHRRIVQLRERLPQLRHVDDARLAPERRSLLQLRHLQSGPVEVKRLAGG